MATVTIDAKDLSQFPKVASTTSFAIESTIREAKNKFGSYITECSKNSNVPEWLLYTVMYCVSGGKNLLKYQTNFNEKVGGWRQGLWNTNTWEVARQLSLEIYSNRLSQAELDYFRGINANWKAALGGNTELSLVGTQSCVKEGNCLNSLRLGNSMNWVYTSFDNKGIDLSIGDPKVAIGYGAIRVGKLWDFYSNKAYEKNDKNKVIDKVIIESVFPPMMKFGSDFSYYENMSLWSKDYDMFNFLDEKNWSKLPAPNGNTKLEKESSMYAPINTDTSVFSSINMKPEDIALLWLKASCGENGIITIANTIAG